MKNKYKIVRLQKVKNMIAILFNNIVEIHFCPVILVIKIFRSNYLVSVVDRYYIQYRNNTIFTLNLNQN